MTSVTINALSKISQDLLSSEPSRTIWILNSNPTVLTEAKVRLRFDNNIVFFRPNDGEILLYEAHQISKQSKPFVKLFGKWTPKDRFDFPIKEKWGKKKRHDWGQHQRSDSKT